MSKLNSTIDSINAAALVIGAAGLFSRLLGIFRDRLLAGIFGASRELDVYYAAFQIPDFLFVLFWLGAGSAAIIPILAEKKQESLDSAKDLIRDLLRIFIMVSFVVSLAAAIFAPLLMKFVAPGFDAESKKSAIALTRIMMLSPVFLGLSSIVSSVIQSFRRFLVFALSSVLYNLGIIAGIVFFLPQWGMAGLASGVVLGAVLHLLIQLPSFFQLGFSFPFSGGLKNFRDMRWGDIFFVPESVLKVVKLSFPRVVTVSISNLTNVFLVAVASVLAAGSITVFQFANNLRFLPVGLFGISFAVAAFPRLSEAFAKKDFYDFEKVFFSSFRQVVFWILPLAVFFFVLRAQIVRVALGAGHFGWEDTRLTAAFLGLAVPAIVAESMMPLIIRSFYAIEDTRSPLKISVFFAFLTAVTALFSFVFLRGEGGILKNYLGNILKVGDVGDISVLGLALGISIGSVGSFIFLARKILKEAPVRFKTVSDYVFRIPAGVIKEIFKILAASLVGGISVFFMLRAVNSFVSLQTFWGVFSQGAISFAAGSAVYALILFWWDNEEVKVLLGIIKNKVSGLKHLPQELNGHWH